MLRAKLEAEGALLPLYAKTHTWSDQRQRPDALCMISIHQSVLLPSLHTHTDGSVLVCMFLPLSEKTSQARLNVHTKSYQLIFFVFPLGMFKRRLPTLLMVSFRAKKMELNLNAAHRQRDPSAKTSLQLCCEILVFSKTWNFTLLCCHR